MPSSCSFHDEKTQERDEDRCGSDPAISILDTLEAPSESSISEGQEERRDLSRWANPGDHDDHRRNTRNGEDRRYDLMRIIGFLTATSSADDNWALIFDVCERASATEANAKEATEALCRVFNCGDAQQQLSATRLWAIILLNSSEPFLHQCAKMVFVDTLEDVLNSQHTLPVVRERFLQVLAAAVYLSSGTPYESSFSTLWGKVKPAGMPDEGVPINPDDALINPLSSQRSTATIETHNGPPVHTQSLQPAAQTDIDSILYAMRLQEEFEREDRTLSAQRTELVKSGQGWFECGICMDETMPVDSIAIIDSCGHTFCRECLHGHVTARLGEHRFPILCPTCTAGKGKGKGKAGEVSQFLAQNLGLTDEQFSLWIEMEMVAFSVLLDCRKCERSMFVARDEHDKANIIICPLPDCNYAWCKECQQSIDLDGPEHSCDGTSELDHLMSQNGWKYCPTCKTPIQKRSGCNHMSCVTPACNTHFCYLCGDLILISAVAQEIRQAKFNHFRKGCKLHEVPK